MPVSEEDMRQTMDVYQKENVEGEELQESLKEDMNADIMVQSQGYGQLRKARAAGGAGGSRVELGVPTVKANLGTTLKHFDGDVSGLRLALEIGVPITIHVNRGADMERSAGFISGRRRSW